jgi:hypothetical protein
MAARSTMSTIAFVTDLIFATKITSTAKALGVPVTMVRTAEKLRETLDALPTDAADRPQVLIDLNATADPVAAVRLAKAHPAHPLIVAYLSHVQAELAQQAREAGADQVMARSGFVQQLPGLLTPPTR